MYGCFMSGFCVCSRVCLFVAAFWWIQIISTKWSSSWFSLSSFMCASWRVNTMTFEQSIWYNLVTILAQTLTATLAGTVNTCCCNYIDEAARNEWGRQISGPLSNLITFQSSNLELWQKEPQELAHFASEPRKTWRQRWNEQFFLDFKVDL